MVLMYPRVVNPGTLVALQDLFAQTLGPVKSKMESGKGVAQGMLKTE